MHLMGETEIRAVYAYEGSQVLPVRPFGKVGLRRRKCVQKWRR